MTLFAIIASVIGIALQIIPLAGIGAGAWLGLTSDFAETALEEPGMTGLTWPKW